MSAPPADPRSRAAPSVAWSIADDTDLHRPARRASLIGYLWPSSGVAIKPLADAFLRMIKMIIAPLLFSTLVVGIAGSGDLKAMGRIGLKAIL